MRAPMPPVYFFAIDVTHAAAASGALAATCRAIRASLDGLPGDERTRVGFLTYDRCEEMGEGGSAFIRQYSRTRSAELNCKGRGEGWRRGSLRQQQLAAGAGFSRPGDACLRGESADGAGVSLLPFCTCTSGTGTPELRQADV